MKCTNVGNRTSEFINREKLEKTSQHKTLIYSRIRKITINSQNYKIQEVKGLTSNSSPIITWRSIHMLFKHSVISRFRIKP